MAKPNSTPTPERSLTEPPTGQVLLGPREGFVESIDTNTALITKRIKSKDLCWVELTIGKYTQTKVKLGYIKTIADPEVVKTVLDRLRQIDCDGIIDSSYLSEALNPDPIALYAAAASEEKPDIVTARLLEGRVAILVDGSPVALTIPHIFLENVQNSNDYYGGNAGVTLKRIIRLLGAFIAILLPGFFLGTGDWFLIMPYFLCLFENRYNYLYYYLNC